MEKPSIKNIYVIPRNDRYCGYRINGKEETHLMQLEKMKTLIYSLLPGMFIEEIHEYLYSFQHFIVDIEHKDVIVLTVSNEDKQREIMLKNREEMLDIRTGINIKKEQEKEKESVNSYWDTTDIYKKFYKKK